MASVALRGLNRGPGETGKALFSREPVVPQPNVTEHMGCASTRLRGRSVPTCVLHLPTGAFNNVPDGAGLDSFYGPNGGTGLFHDVDETDRVHCPAARTSESSCRTGKVTIPTLINPRKLDDVFLNDQFTDVPGDATTTEISDRVPLRGWASLLPGSGGEGGSSGPGGPASARSIRTDPTGLPCPTTFLARRRQSCMAGITVTEWASCWTPSIVSHSGSSLVATVTLARSSAVKWTRSNACSPWQRLVCRWCVRLPETPDKLYEI
ncbi:hypothetical protein [Streptomyces sp. NPDC050704]|uniref:hypothetical protein n=1 Tax=Streptomyces sp. NPDC050704 TaxID=3157219 RepID=UPI00343FC7E1